MNIVDWRFEDCQRRQKKQKVGAKNGEAVTAFSPLFSLKKKKFCKQKNISSNGVSFVDEIERVLEKLQREFSNDKTKQNSRCSMTMVLIQLTLSALPTGE